MRNIIIVQCTSTGKNYVQDIIVYYEKFIPMK